MIFSWFYPQFAEDEINEKVEIFKLMPGMLEKCFPAHNLIKYQNSKIWSGSNAQEENVLRSIAMLFNDVQ